MPETTVPADRESASEANRDALTALRGLLRPELAEVQAYVPHVPPGIEVKLDANEAPPSRSPHVKECVARALAAVPLERYPDPRALRLKEAIAKRTSARAEDLLVGTGSDEIIALVLNAFAWPKKRGTPAVLLAQSPTFVMYRVTAKVHGMKPVEVPLDASWDLDVAMTGRAIDLTCPNVVVIASPNNPTGNVVSVDRLEAVLSAARASFAIVDEAYVDYAGDGASKRTLRESHPHLGILRTVSKIGLAALRVGWLEADASLVAEIDKTRQPFNVSATSQAAAAAVLEEAWDDVQRDVACVRAARERLSDAIAALEGFTVTPSGANFVWVKTPRPAEAIYDALVRDGILVRSFHASGGRLASQLRITVGTDAENDRLVASMSRIAREGAV
jgi:histidinol-phosphate aminotransferase